jgi:hypothetical protein
MERRIRRQIKEIERTDRIVGERVGESNDNSNSEIREAHLRDYSTELIR